jgi:hypothetical protein
LIFRLTKKFVTSFVSIGSEVTSFFNFLKFAFCRCCYVASASLLPVKSLIGPKTNQQQATNPLRTPGKQDGFLRLLLPAF